MRPLTPLRARERAIRDSGATRISTRTPVRQACGGDMVGEHPVPSASRGLELRVIHA